MRRTFFNYCVIFTAFATLFRYRAYKFNFDGTFFTDKNFFAWLTIAFCFFVAITPLRNYMQRKNREYAFAGIVNLPTKIITLIIAIMAFIGVFFIYQNSDMNLSGDGALISSVSLVTPFYISSFLFCLYLIFLTVVQFMNCMEFLKTFKIIEIIPIIWGVLLLVYLYVHYASSLRVTEDIISILGGANLMLALLNRGKILVDMEEKQDGLKKILIHAGVSFAMWSSLLISELILTIQNDTLYVSYIPLEIVVICTSLSLMLLVFCTGDNFTLVRTKIKLKHGSRYKD